MQIKSVAAKTINGLSVRTDNITEMSVNGKIAPLWQAFDEMVPVDYKHGERVYGVYFDYESDHAGKFTVLAGFDGRSLPTGMKLETVTIPAAKYLVFHHQGTMPQIAIDAWTEVWNYFSSQQVEHERLYSTDFEYYPNQNEIEVHIAIR
ncbi:effector binding domain-containing protein [Paraglaciecola aquimarina]|uniref:Effector binding domain-containing protein n=1 Tax=Paraglaciecola aquimarina TaxID=1235557 RepID=A0ABU3T0T4_9ALTE|nr:effector binding domain-containing protein [Paraglaciecola aquimarina]MDU0355891.1 effector binding domain-containing protein [Paraglaciecola aquimarina]